MRRLSVLLALSLTLAASALAVDELTRRLAPFRDPEATPTYGVHAVIYDRYPSGRPRRVVAALGDLGSGVLMLFRFPDSAEGRPRVLDRQDLDSGPVDVILQRIVHPKDIIVSLHARHGESAIVEHVAGDSLVQIADGFTEAVDLDGDHVPEIISTFYVGKDDCGVHGGQSLARWNGERFVDDQRHYVIVLGVYGSNSDEVQLSGEKRYVIRLYGPGRVLVDGKAYPPGVPFEFATGCHTFDLQGQAKTRAFVEELP